MNQGHMSGYTHRTKLSGSITLEPVLTACVTFLCLFSICDMVIGGAAQQTPTRRNSFWGGALVGGEAVQMKTTTETA